jgi:hypothetical protein
MPYVHVRGNLGVCNTKVYGLTERELRALDVGSSRLRKEPVNDVGDGRPRESRAAGLDGVVYYSTPVHVINELEYHLGYRVVSGGSQDGQPVWTLSRQYVR